MGLRAFFHRWRGSAHQSGGRADCAWAIGDLAECISGGQWVCCVSRETFAGPIEGERAVVSAMRIGRLGDKSEALMLSFKRWGSKGFHASHFRKIVPQPDRAEGADADFLQSLHPARVSDQA